MRLSSIKLAGFKSFVEATKIPFPDAMTCVVGPNGCGKSNVIDAVRWVLGESSAKNLRGDAMSDVIFNGAATRKPVSQAAVELIFDNTQGRLPGTMASRNQVAIKRVVTRDGQSLYYLNGSKCRKRDITDIFLGTGLGPRSYAIIEQGMISRLIESKPHELRVFIEEAAGVSKYKERRRETQTRIRSTRENLERLLDVRSELQAQLDKLDTQAQQAQQYRELKARQRQLKSELAVLKWQKLHAQQLEKSQQLAQLKEQLTFIKEAHSGEQDVLSAYQQQVDDTQHALAAAQQQQFQTDNQLARVEQQHIHSKQQLQQLHATLQQSDKKHQALVVDKRQQKDAVAQKQRELAQVREQLELLQAQAEQLTEQHLVAQEQFEQLQSQQHQQREQLYQNQQQVQQSQHELHALSAEQRSNTEQLQEVQEQLKAHHEQPINQQLQDSEAEVKTLTTQLASAKSEQQRVEKQLTAAQQAYQQGKNEYQQHQDQARQLSAKQQAMAELLAQHQEQQSLLFQLEVQSGYEAIIEAALMQLQHLQLTEQRQGSWLQPTEHQVKAEAVSALIQQGEYPDLLDRIAYVENGDITLLADDYWFAVVDSQGTLHGRHWALENEQAQQGILAKRQQLAQLDSLLESAQREQQQSEQYLQQLHEERGQYTQQLDNSKKQVHELSRSHASMQTRLELLREQQQQWQQQQQRLSEKQQALMTRDRELQDKQALTDDQLQQAQEQLEQAQQHNEQLQGQYEQGQQRLRQCEQQLREHQARVADMRLSAERQQSELSLSENKLAHIDNELSRLALTVEQAQAQQQALEQPLEQMAEQIETLLQEKERLSEQQVDLRHQLDSAQQNYEQNKSRLAQGEQQREQLQEQIQQALLAEQTLTLKAQQALAPLEELKVTLKEVLESLDDDAAVGRWQAQLTQIDKQLDTLGAVNLAAIDEFASAKQRKAYLDEQLQDLTDALEILESAIAKIDRQTKAQFKSTFDQINDDLKELFPKVFGGGSAYLELTSDDLLESGVAIMARPPGKKNSTIHLLSGGEKALTALSLVFSIFRLNPAPFCMLDEVDAPLDDANVGRFCRLVEEMSQTVQFIYISHNKIAMEMAGRLTGVTMAEPGVSRMVAVDIEQAVEMAQAS